MVPQIRAVVVAAGFGLPAGMIGALVSLALWNMPAGATVALLLSATLTAAVARESNAPRPVAVAALMLGLISTAAFFVWGVSSYET